MDEPWPPRQQTIHLIRHCEGEHNRSAVPHLLADAVLTDHGVAQASLLSLGPAFLEHPLPQLVVVSPLRRCVQTCLHAFGPEMPCELMPSVMENSTMKCDCATPALGRAMLAAEKHGWEKVLRQYEALPAGWELKGKDWKASIHWRFTEAIEWIASRPEEHVAIVSHHDFIRSNVAESLQLGEVRTYVLSDGELRNPADPSWLWRIDGGLERKSKPPSRTSSSSSLASLGRGLKKVASFPAALSDLGSGSKVRHTSPAKTRQSKSVHGGTFFLNAVQEQRDSETATIAAMPVRELKGKGITVHGGTAYHHAMRAMGVLELPPDDAAKPP